MLYYAGARGERSAAMRGYLFWADASRHQQNQINLQQKEGGAHSQPYQQIFAVFM